MARYFIGFSTGMARIIIFQGEFMNGIKKMAIVMIAALVLVMAFTGCNRSSGSAGGSTGFTFNGYPMNARDQTISWFIGEGYQVNNAYASADDSPFTPGSRTCWA